MTRSRLILTDVAACLWGSLGHLHTHSQEPAIARESLYRFAPQMKTIDEMLNLDLLTPEQHAEISAWIARSASPDEILQMPAPLWQAVERASKVMGIDEDLLRPPALDYGALAPGG